MTPCPLCESFAVVSVDHPCYCCGLSWAEVAPSKMVAIVPGWFLLEPAKPAVARFALNRLRQSTENVIVNLGEIHEFSSTGIEVLVALNDVAAATGVKLILANASSDWISGLQASVLNPQFRIADKVEDGLKMF